MITKITPIRLEEEIKERIKKHDTNVSGFIRISILERLARLEITKKK